MRVPLTISRLRNMKSKACTDDTYRSQSCSPHVKLRDDAGSQRIIVEAWDKLERDLERNTRGAPVVLGEVSARGAAQPAHKGAAWSRRAGVQLAWPWGVSGATREHGRVEDTARCAHQWQWVVRRSGSPWCAVSSLSCMESSRVL